MTTYYPHRRDCWLYPLTAATSAPVRVYRGAGTSDPGTNTSISAGTYYAILTASGLSAPQRLWLALTAALTGALASGTVTISAQSGYLGQERLRVAWSGGEWALRPSLMPLVAAWMGADPSALELRSDASGVLHLPWSYQGAWWSESPWDGAAYLKIPSRVADTVYSSERIWDAATVDWGTQLVRTIRYAYLPSARLWRGRSLDPERARLARLPLGDPNATFEPVWEALVAADRAYPVLLWHDTEPEQGLSWSAVPRVEAVTLWRPWADYGAQLRDMGIGGDYWSLEVALRVDEARGVASGWSYAL